MSWRSSTADPAQARALAEELGGSATALDPGEPLGGDVIVFAVYYPAIKDAVREYADRLAGKVVVDITNPVDTETWDDLDHAGRNVLRRGGGRARPERNPRRESVQHHVRSYARRGRGRRTAARRPDRRRRRRREAEGRTARLRGRTASARRRPAAPGTATRAAWLPAHRESKQPLDLGFGSTIKLNS